MFRVLIASVDWRVALFAVLIAAAASTTSLHTWTYARDYTGIKRLGWQLLAGACAAVGFWATHFLTIRAFEWGVPTNYVPILVASALFAPVAAATFGCGIALAGNRVQAAAGGAVIGLGLVLTHAIGTWALDVPATLHRAPLLAVPTHVAAVVLCSAALVVHCQVGGRLGLLFASGLLTIATCSMHFVAVGAFSVSPDPYMFVSTSSIGGSTLTTIIACTTAAMMLAARAATLTVALSTRDAERDLRQKHQALLEREAELSSQNILFDVALASLPHGLCMVDADQRLVVCNKRYADMYGLPAELTKPGTLIGKLVEHEIAAGIYAGSDPQAYRTELLGEVTRATVKTHRLSGGRFVMVSRRPTPGGGWIAIHEDITERRRLQDTEREAKETLGAIFDAVPAAIVCLAADQRVMLWSRGAELIFGYTAEETIGQPLKLVPSEGKAESDQLFERALAGETLRDVRVVRRRKDGSLVDVSFSSAALRDRDGSVRGIVCALDDLTEWEQLAARLEVQNDLLKQREEALEIQNERLDAALASMVQGLAMFDSDERLILANARYAELYGLDADEVKPGVTLEDIVKLRSAKGFYSGVTAEEVLRAMRERKTGKSPTQQVRRSANGQVLSVSVQPRADGGWVTTLYDISQQEHLKEQLQVQNDQLDAAINTMPQGLAMFDADQRLIVCNKHYSEMYGLAAEQVKPGTTVREIFNYRMANGFYHVKDTEQFVDSWANNFGQRSSRIQELADGRIISVLRAQTADGGRVVTHEDITERQKLTAQLEQQHQLLKAHEERLRAQNVQLDAALNNMVQGLAMFDADLRIVVANNRYAELYNLAPEQVKPGTQLREILEQRFTKGEAPGQSVEELFERTISRIRDTGACQYTTRLHDGRYIAVSAQPIGDGYTVTTHQDITEQRRSEAKIVHMALHDALTGLPNRVLFNERLEHALQRARRGDVVAAHLLDLDLFKNVNDTLGHAAGDKLLKDVSERLRTLVRETDIVARMGGDEFAIVQASIDQPSDAAVLARRVIDVVSQPYEIDGQHVVIGASVGIAMGPTDGASTDQLMRNADLALYRAKGDGRGAFCFFEPGMDAQLQERRALENDMRKALVAGQFELFYQPIVNLQSNKINGVEALLRWRHPERGLVSPGLFVPVAEEIGFIVALGDWVIRQACITAARWPDDIKIAVNLSPVQFRNPGLVQTVVNALATSGLPPRRLELEITESTLLQDSDATLSTLFQLRELGVGIAMDDFGTGYSSLSYLQSFPFDRIKIDRSFVKDISEGVGSLSIVRAMATLAKGLGMETTAEGVETQVQRDMVASEGCTEMQGFLFSKPLPAHEIDRQFFPEMPAKPAVPVAETKGPRPNAVRAGGR